MWKQKSFSLESIGVQGITTLSDIQKIDLARLSRLVNQTLFQSDGKQRALLEFHEHVGKGAFGAIQGASRYAAGGEKCEVVVKKPLRSDIHFTTEALIQWLCRTHLDEYGAGWAIPRVLDIFLMEGRGCFSMEIVRGKSVAEWFLASTQADLDCALLLAQIALILWNLQIHLGLDHRDLKVNNLMIRPEPCQLVLECEKQLWTLHSPFQVILLDFGYACLGSQSRGGHAVVNLGDVLPPLDPCPKEGRDIFHILVSLFSVPLLREKLSPAFQEKVEKWLCIRGKDFAKMARRWGMEDWVYLITSQRDFQADSCTPASLLRDLNSFLGSSYLSVLPLP